MKKSFFRIVSLLLTVASLVSLLSIFSWAEENTDPEGNEEAVTGEPLTDVELLYERDYQEGWDVDNGFKLNKSGHNLTIDREELADSSYNYFMRYEATTSLNAATATIDFGTRVAREKASVISFAIKADDAASFSQSIMKITMGQKSAKDLIFLSNKQLFAFNANKENLIANLSDNAWARVTMLFDWSDTTTFNVKVYIGENYDLNNPLLVCSEPYGTNSEGKPKTDNGIATFVITIPGAGNETNAKKQDGMSFCIDDLQAYQNITKPRTIDEIKSIGDGINIDPLANKVIDIVAGSDVKTADQLLEEALCLKLGVPYALMRDKKISIDEYCIPDVVNGEIVVSLQLILDFIGYPYYVHPDGESYDITTGLSSTYITIGRDTANVNGEMLDLTVAPGYLEGTQALVIAMADIPKLFPGWNLLYDDMGLIIMYENVGNGNENLISREKNLDAMLSMMKRFVFDTVTTDKNGNELEADASYRETGKKVYEDVKAATYDDEKGTSFNHPYIIADQEKFNSLNKAYAATESTLLKEYLTDLVAKAEAYYDETAEEKDGEYVAIQAGKEPLNPYTNPDDEIVDTEDAYSASSNLYEIEKFTAHLVDLAFAYQVTGDDKYAKLAYDMSLVFGEWTHWAPGYMINCATATSNFALSFDWLYNVYTELYGADAVKALADILYTKGVSQGYNSSIGANCDYPRPSGTGDRYTNRTDSWNAVCSSGMIIGSLALMEYEEYNDNIAYLVGNNIQNLANYGLDQYAPDGSYIESATYWAIGTNAFMKLIMAFDSAANDDYGFVDTWGIDSTFYYACYIENPSGDAWNYHEDGVGSIITADELGVDTQMFGYAGIILGDENLAAIRKNQLEKGKKVSIFDAIFYSDEVVEDVELSLDYTMEGIDAFISRSDWEDGALYVGLMSGANSYSPYTEAVVGGEQFGQLDAGNFVYTNGGVDWFIDLGSDNFDAYNYFGSYRFRYYRNSAEGQNVVFFTSQQSALPYGQDPNGSGKLIETYVDEAGDGSYAIVDNSAAYGSYVISAQRGMLLFENRSVVVIQDEISMNNTFEDVCWVAHTMCDIEIDESGRTAYLIKKDENGYVEKTLRATLISSSSGMKFEAMDASTPILRQTIKNDPTEFSREGVNRLVVQAKEMLGVDLAVVFEEVESTSDTKSVSYSWVNMIDWESVFTEEDYDDGLRRRDRAQRSDIINKSIVAEMFLDDETAFGEEFVGFYESLTTIAYTLKTFGVEGFADNETAYWEAYDNYVDFCEEYELYAEYVNGCMDDISKAMNFFIGMN